MTNSLFRNIIHLVLFLPACHALGLNILTNKEIGTYLVDDLGNGVFNVGVDTFGRDEFDFRVEISTTNADEAGLWGLSQELSISTRLMCYENGECISSVPTHEAPILDGDENTIPFYGSFAQGTIAADGESIELRLTDGPSQFVLNSLFLDANGVNTSPLISFEASEEFTVTLLKQNVDGDGTLGIAHQCKWAYTYSLSLNDLQDGHTFQPNFNNCVEVDDEPAAPIVVGPVAGEGGHNVYENANSQQFNEPRFNVFGVGAATWKM